MVVLRSGVGAAPMATTPERPSDLDTSSEFLSLLPASQRRSTRVKRSHRVLDDSFSSLDHSSMNVSGHADMKQENRSSLNNFQRSRRRRAAAAVSFSNTEVTASSPVNEAKAGGCCTRKSSQLQREEKASSGNQQADVPDKVEGSSTPKRSRFDLESRHMEEKEYRSVRRSSRITRCKVNSPKQSVLYNRLITNTAEAVLQKMDDMQKMRRRLSDRESQEERGVYTRGRMRMLLRSNMGSKDVVEEKQGGNKDGHGEEEEDGEDEEDDDDEDDDDDDDDEDDDDDDDDEDDDDGEDEEEENQRRYDFRQRKNVVRYQAPQDEPKEPRKRSLYFKDHSSPNRHGYRFSPYNRKASRRRHAIHNSDSTSSSSDDEQFQRKRIRNKSVNRFLPLNLKKDDILGIHKDRMKIGASLADVDPMHIDRTVRFESIGGLRKHILSLKEMVVFPLLYPEVFDKFKIQPPRGCLFYGPPGTGKTLVARALANECTQGERKVSFFMRKGADCLSKWVGESERQLRLLFDQAYQMRPSIIFFDEIDGLAPVRSSRQDQIHSSIVSTLLALMDGLDSRGEVVVIGATNRLDSIDPALRRPGRFDREFLFGLPDRWARKDILKIHTRQWTPPPSDTFLEKLVDNCVGYCGADIKAVCSEAALCALRRRYPQIYTSAQKLVLDVDSIAITNQDFVCAMSKIVPASQRAVVSPAKALIPVIRPLLCAALQDILHILGNVFPHAEQSFQRQKRQDGTCGILDDLILSEEEDIGDVGKTSLSSVKKNAADELLNFSRSVLSEPTSCRPRLLLEGRPGSGQSSHLAPAVLHALEKFTLYTLDLAVLFGSSGTIPEENCAQVFVEAKRTSPSILYVPQIGQWWETVSPALRATFLSLLNSIPTFSPIFLLATCSMQYNQLSMEVQDLFSLKYGEVFQIQPPSRRERRNFFEDLILNQASRAPISKKKAVLNALEVLSVAAPPPPCQLTEEEAKRLEEQEEDTLRELRLFLRDVTNRLSQDKRFKAFTKPVDLAEVPDYAGVIKKPMDLSTVLCKIDLHQYNTVKEFLEDVDLIWQNALKYNPDQDPSDRQIRHRACALKDTAHAIIRAELDEDFEKLCEEIKVSCQRRGGSSLKFAPTYYHVLPKPAADAKVTNSTPKTQASRTPALVTPTKPSVSAALKSTGEKKRRRKSRWSSGIYVKKRLASSHRDREDAHLATDEDVQNGDDKADADGGEEEQTVMDLELASADGSRVGEDGEERWVESSNAAEGEAGACENSNRQHKRDYMDTGDAEKQTERAENGYGEAISVENHEESHTGMEIETSSHGTFVQNETEKLKETGNKIVNVAEEEPTQMATPGTVREDLNTERLQGCMTRAKKNAALQQRTVNLDKAQQILEQKTPLVVDRDKLKELLERVVEKSEGYEVFQLERLYTHLCQSIYRHRREYNKTALVKELEQEIEDFC
eukprot:XP_011603687.1 PREDICTED: ATPase family AAA domain-containing protein 2 isoform X2 [Takifugu rubripes]